MPFDVDTYVSNAGETARVQAETRGRLGGGAVHWLPGDEFEARQALTTATAHRDAVRAALNSAKAG